MALTNTSTQVNFSICQSQGCRTFELTDKTGVYNPLTNTGGYETPNSPLSEVTQVYLDIQDPSGTTTRVDVTDVYALSIFPNILNQGVIITEAMGGLTDKYPDGVYIFTYIVQGLSVEDGTVWESTVTKYILFSCQTQCSIDNMFSKVNPQDCNCAENSLLQAALDAQGFLEAACQAMACGKSRMAAELLLRAQFEASKTNCTSC